MNNKGIDGEIIVVDGFAVGDEVCVIPFDDLPHDLRCRTSGGERTYCWLGKTTIDDMSKIDSFFITRFRYDETHSYTKVYLSNVGAYGGIFVSTEMIVPKDAKNKRVVEMSDDVDLFLQSFERSKQE